MSKDIAVSVVRSALLFSAYLIDWKTILVHIRFGRNPQFETGKDGMSGRHGFRLGDWYSLNQRNVVLLVVVPIVLLLLLLSIVRMAMSAVTERLI